MFKDKMTAIVNWRRKSRSRTIMLPFLSFCIMIVGIIWMVGPDSAFQSSSLDVTFSMAPRQVWGAGWFLSGLLTLITLSNLAAAIMTGLCGFFTLTLLGALFSGISDSWTAFSWPLMVTCMLVGILTRVGTKVPPGYAPVSMLAPATHFIHSDELDNAAIVMTGEHHRVEGDGDGADGCKG